MIDLLPVICNYDQAVDEFGGVLPGDLMLAILQRLPIKSLLRFKSISKSWHFVFLSSTFIAKHQLYLQNRNISHLHRHKNTKQGVYLISEKNDDGAAITATRDVHLPFEIDGKVSIVGCSNGLVCIRLSEASSFSRESMRFAIWNPATRQFKLLTSLQLEAYHSPSTAHQLCCTIDGFSYVPITGDYKLVRILVFENKQSASERCIARVEVLNMATNCWREAVHELPYNKFHYHQVIANGCLHLLVFRREGPFSMFHAFLLRFDLEKERFTHLSVPSACNHLINCSLNGCLRKLTIFKENVAMFVSPKFKLDEYRGDGINVVDEELGNFFELWVYDGMNCFWIKQFIFGPLPRRSFPVGFWRNGEIIVRQKIYVHASNTSRLEAFLYNPYTKEKRANPCCKSECNLTFHPYAESLVQI